MPKPITRKLRTKKEGRYKHRPRICVGCGVNFTGGFHAWYHNERCRYRSWKKGICAPQWKIQPEGATLEELRAMCHKPTFQFGTLPPEYAKAAKKRHLWKKRESRKFKPMHNHLDKPCIPVAVALHQDQLWLGKGEEEYCLHIVDAAYGLDEYDMKTLASFAYIVLQNDFKAIPIKKLSTNVKRKALGYKMSYLGLKAGSNGVEST